ncbi:MAG: T9SS type A sorting domain-containing protein [Saprospiraceae bacterium]
MKAFYLSIFFILIGIFSYGQEICSSTFAGDYFNINALNARLNSVGDLFTDVDGLNGLEVFNAGDSTTISTFFQAGLVIGALDDTGEERVAWRTYYYDGADSDYSSGHLVGDIDDTLRCARWDKLWRVTSVEIYLHLTEIESNGEPLIRRKAIYDYPATGNPYFTNYNDFLLPENVELAPFYDANGDAIYNPDDGDYPLPTNVHPTAYPDLLLWSVYNTTAPVWRNFTFGKRLALEIQQTTFGYHCEQNKLLDKTLFTQHRVINRSTQTWDSLFVGNRFDGDIGNYADDCLGTAADLHTVYGYNCDEKDGDLHTPLLNVIPNGNIPVQAITFLNYDLDRTRAFWSSGLGIYSAQYQEDDRADHLYYSLNGNWSDNTPLTYGGYGYQTESDMTNFIFPDPPYDEVGWSMPGNYPPSADLRGMMSHYVGDFLPGAEFQLDQAWSYHRGENGNHLSNIRLMYEQVPLIQKWYDNGFANLPCLIYYIQNIDNQLVINIFPNPTTGKIQLDLNDLKIKNLRVLNSYGANILTTNQSEIDLATQPAGVYFIIIEMENGQFLQRKILKL